MFLHYLFYSFQPIVEIGMYSLIFTIQLLFLLLHGVSFFEAFSARFYSWRPQYEEDNNKVTCIYVMYVRKPNNGSVALL